MLERQLIGYDHLFLQRTWVGFPALPKRLKTICNSNSRRSNVLFPDLFMGTRHVLPVVTYTEDNL